MKHAIFSQNLDQFVKWYDTFNKEQIRIDIKKHLTEHPTDTIEHCKEFNKTDTRKYYGMNIINLYECNPKTQKPSLCIFKSNKTYFKELS